MNLHDWYKRVDIASQQATRQRSAGPPSAASTEAEPPAQAEFLSVSAVAAPETETLREHPPKNREKSSGGKSRKKQLRRIEGDVDQIAVDAETREQLLSRLLDPILSLEEAAKVLNVCPTTVRRYTNSGALAHLRTQGNQRRFLLSDVLAFLKSQQEGLPGSRASRINAVARQGRAYAADSPRNVAELERGS